MKIWERWAFLALLGCTVLVFTYIPLGRVERCSNSCKNCPAVRHTIEISNKAPHINWVLSNETARTNADLLPRPYPRSQHVTRPSLKKPGWILDCITWENKWEVTAVDADPHEFLIEEKLKAGEEPGKREKTFREIFAKKDWPANDASYYGLKASGPGAMLKNAQGVMAALHTIISKLKLHLRKSRISLLDIPCGDLQWISKFLLTRTDIDYTGLDIVPDIINHHRKEFARLPRVHFQQWDVVKTPLNKSYDLVLCRDMLQHLWKADAMKALLHISEGGSKFLLTTTFPDTSHNLDVEKDALGGRRYPYNLELPPFMLDSPLCSSYDWNIEHLGLWSLPLKQKYDF